MTLVVGAGALLFLHQLPVSVVVARATQLQVLLLHGVGWYLLDGQPVQRLLSGEGEEMSGDASSSCFYSLSIQTEL